MAMAMAVSSSSLQLSLPLRRPSINSFQIQGLSILPVRRLGYYVQTLGRRNLLVVRAETENEPSDGADVRRLEELEARLGLKRKSRREGAGSAEAPRPTPESRPKMPAKAWDDMSLREKAWELYIGDKGALFWLNKLAYASIYLIIGGWIVFRFIGPALGWYELDSGLLPPSQVLSGTAGR